MSGANTARGGSSATSTIKVCEYCGQVIKSVRSVEISTHFHAHVTQIAREIAMDRNEVYIRILLKACEIEVDGGDPYPYVIHKDVLYPNPTHTCTNKQMMTAVEACHLVSAHLGIELKEKDIQEGER